MTLPHWGMQDRQGHGEEVEIDKPASGMNLQ